MAVTELEVGGRPQAAEAPAGRFGVASAILRRLIVPFERGALPPPAPATGFYTDTTVCIGCKACEVACKQWNQLPADDFRWTGNSYDNTETLSASSWRHVKFIEQFPASGPPATPEAGDPGPLAKQLTLEDLVGDGQAGRWLMMSDVCKHCVAAPCQHACPTGAIIYNEFANVYIQPDICNGCTYCIAACPFGVITRSTIDGHAHKCTLCFDRQRDGLVPACAKSCPTASIQFGPVEQLRERAKRRVAELHARGETGAYLYGAEATDRYSSLNSFYLLIDTPETYGLPSTPTNPWLAMGGDYARAVGAGLLTIAALVAALFLTGG